jgi:hypothetical protein
MKALPIAILTGAFIATGAFGVARNGNTATPVDWSSTQRVEIRMIEYEFVPNQLRFRRGLPYQLHLVNVGKEGHDFTAPDFFTSVQVKNTGALNESKTSVFLQPEQDNRHLFYCTERRIVRSKVHRSRLGWNDGHNRYRLRLSRSSRKGWQGGLHAARAVTSNFDPGRLGCAKRKNSCVT